MILSFKYVYDARNLYLSSDFVYSVMHGKRERLTDIWFVFGILKFIIIFGNFTCVTWILYTGLLKF
jgi:hypothetical protein